MGGEHDAIHITDESYIEVNNGEYKWKIDREKYNRN